MLNNSISEELPKIQENIRKGFQDTQKTVNRWISDFKRKIDGEDEDDDIPAKTGTPERQNFGASTSQQIYGIRKNAERSRQSGDRERYDSDPHVLGDDFTQLELRDDEGTFGLTRLSLRVYMRMLTPRFRNRSPATSPALQPPPRQPRSLQTHPNRSSSTPTVRPRRRSRQRSLPSADAHEPATIAIR